MNDEKLPPTESIQPIDIKGLDTAHFECVFPTCGGICCQNGRPPLEKDEDERIAQNLDKFLPHLRPEARTRIESKGYLTKRMKEGLPSLAVVKEWCVFHNEGCVLHKVGALEGDKWKYKPWRCVAFPLERSPKGEWHVRQWRVKGEAWDLFCLNPKESPKLARETLSQEIEFVREREQSSAQPPSAPKPPSDSFKKDEKRGSVPR
jgi:Protein of unknown function (DUF3109)